MKDGRRRFALAEPEGGQPSGGNGDEIDRVVTRSPEEHGAEHELAHDGQREHQEAGPRASGLRESGGAALRPRE